MSSCCFGTEFCLTRVRSAAGRPSRSRAARGRAPSGPSACSSWTLNGRGRSRRAARPAGRCRPRGSARRRARCRRGCTVTVASAVTVPMPSSQTWTSPSRAATARTGSRVADLVRCRGGAVVAVRRGGCDPPAAERRIASTARTIQRRRVMPVERIGRGIPSLTSRASCAREGRAPRARSASRGPRCARSRAPAPDPDTAAQRRCAGRTRTARRRLRVQSRIVGRARAEQVAQDRRQLLVVGPHAPPYQPVERRRRLDHLFARQQPREPRRTAADRAAAREKGRDVPRPLLRQQRREPAAAAPPCVAPRTRTPPRRPFLVPGANAVDATFASPAARFLQRGRNLPPRIPRPPPPQSPPSSAARVACPDSI